MSSFRTIICLGLWRVLLVGFFGILSSLASPAYSQSSSWYQSEQTANSEFTIGQEIVEVALSQVGITEATGNNDGFDVEKYLATTGLGQGYAWCAAFVNWTMIQAGADCPADKKAWSPSWFPPERTYWQVGIIEFYPPAAGDVFGIHFSSKNRIAHVGIIESWNGKYASTIEGNTNEAGSREGDGVWRKKRIKRQVSKVSKWTNNE